MSEKQTRLEGLVVGILNACELVINLGRTHGVHRGMKFAVLAESPLEIRDPNSGEVLDTIDREKVRVEASEARERVSICRTYRVKKVPAGAFVFSSVADFMQPAREIPETLSVRDSSMPAPLSERDSYVKIKDRVIQILDE